MSFMVGATSSSQNNDVNFLDKPEVGTNETCEMTRANSTQHPSHHDEEDDEEEDSHLILEEVQETDQMIASHPVQHEPNAGIPASPRRIINNTTGRQTTRWWWPVGARVPPTKKLAEHLARRLYDASDILVARLFTYLSSLPELQPLSDQHHPPRSILIGSGDDSNAMSGVTLPASALAWLASQIIYLRRSRQYHPSNKNNNNQSLNDSLDDDFLDAAYSLDCDHLEQQNLIENALWMGSSMRDRLLLIHFLLPRATHLRIVLEAWPPPKKTTRPTRKSRRLRRDHHGNQQQQQRSSSSPLGDDHDLAFSSMSVQSALTEDDAGPPEPNAASFLQNYYHLEQRPRIEISIFSNLQVLVLDQVAPDCILNLHHARHTLRVLRVERACIYNLHTFLFPKPSSQQPPFASRQQDISNADDPLAAPPSSQEAEEGDDGNMVYWELTHIKLSHCCIGEMSKMRASPTNPHPPLSRCPRLVSLCLSHNQIFKSSTALAGLSSLPWLSKLDLSYNQISSMKNAHLRLGNLKVLILTGNKIRSASGLDRLYSLEQLWLDGNQIHDVASLNGLGRLPELTALYLFGNPLELLYPLRYRIDVLNLFMCRLTSSLGRNATYRQLQQVLPVLDGNLVSLREMVALRDRTFESITSPSIPRTERLDSSTEPETDRNVDGEDAVVVDTFVTLETTSTSITRKPRQVVSARAHVGRVRRGARRRKAVIEDSYVVVTWPPSSRDILEHVETQVDEEQSSSDVLHKTEKSMNVAFSINDVISAISGDHGVAVETTAAEEQALLASDLVTENDDVAEEVFDGDDTLVNGVMELAAQLIEDDAVLTNPDPSPFMSQDITQLSLPTIKQYDDDKVVSDDENEQKNEHALALNPFEDQPTSPAIVEDKAAATIALENEVTSANPFDNEATSINPFENDATFGNEQQLTTSTIDSQLLSQTLDSQPAWVNAFESQALKSKTRKDASSIESLSENIDRDSQFTDDIWLDDRSVASSVGGPREELSVDVKFQLAEQNSTYDGPPGCQDLLVLEHLELYFRCFVFPTTIPPAVQAALDETMEDTSTLALVLYPRLQLQPIDRQLMMTTSNATTAPGVAPLSQLLTHRERLVRVWREDVIACGKPAARRLFPNRHTRLGFHGDILWSNNKIDVVTEIRTAILCLSNAALYIIMDHDAVADKLQEHTKKFPLPISKEAKFHDAPWPHAVARHSLFTLEQITIGFGFQRLVLRFANATFPSNDHFTYNLLVSNKVDAISILQDIQKSDVGIVSNTLGDETSESRLEIDNDDKHFLEALALAVAPAVIEAVLHYQVLQQRWQHGERGSVRRACVITDSKLFLLDEDYAGDGSTSFEAGASKRLGDVSFRLVDSADLQQITQVKAADADPKAITIVIQPLSRLQRTHRWRLVCRDGDGAERLVEDVRKAMAFL